MRFKSLIGVCTLILAGCGTNELQMQVDSLRATNQTLTERLTRLEQEQGELQRKVAETGNIRVPTGISAVPSARRGGTAAPIPATDGSYGQAYALFQAGDVDNAIPAFERFLQSGGASGEEAALAQYWLGEAYYTKRNYDMASRYFGAYLKVAPQSARSPHALQKLVESLRAQGRTQDADIVQSQGVSALAP